MKPTLRLGVLAALVALALSACGGEENKKGATGGTAPTNGQIVFRRWFNPDETKGAIFTTNPDGSHAHQITHSPEGWIDDGPALSPDGKMLVFDRERRQRVPQLGRGRLLSCSVRPAPRLLGLAGGCSSDHTMEVKLPG